MAAYLGTFSDSRALPLLFETFDQMPWNSGGEFGEPFAGQPMLDLLGAITEQLGELSAKQWQTYERAWQLRSPGQPPPSLVPPPDRESLPGPKSSRPATPIIAATSSELHRKALLWYGTLRNTAAMLEVSPAKVHHYVCTMASVA